MVKPTAQGLLSNQLSAKQQGILSGVLASQAALTTIIAPLVATNLFAYTQILHQEKLIGEWMAEVFV